MITDETINYKSCEVLISQHVDYHHENFEHFFSEITKCLSYFMATDSFSLLSLSENP